MKVSKPLTLLVAAVGTLGSGAVNAQKPCTWKRATELCQIYLPQAQNVVNNCQDYFHKENPSADKTLQCKKAVFEYKPIQAETVNAEIRKCMNNMPSNVKTQDGVVFIPLDDNPPGIPNHLSPPKSFKECFSTHEKVKRYITKIMYEGIKKYPALEKCLNRIIPGGKPSLKAILADSAVEKSFEKAYTQCVKDPNSGQKVEL